MISIIISLISVFIRRFAIGNHQQINRTVLL